MVTSNENTQSLADFRQNAEQTIERMTRTGEAEVLTVDGQPKAVLITPEVYDELRGFATTEEDLENMRISIEQLDRGEGIPAEVFFAELEAELKAMPAAEEKP